MTCGYVCPVCEGKGFMENLEPCDYCTRLPAGETPVQPGIKSLEPVAEISSNPENSSQTQDKKK